MSKKEKTIYFEGGAKLKITEEVFRAFIFNMYNLNTATKWKTFSTTPNTDSIYMLINTEKILYIV